MGRSRTTANNSFWTTHLVDERGGGLHTLDRGQNNSTNFFCTMLFERPSGHGHPRQKSWTSAPTSSFSCEPGGTRKCGQQSLVPELPDLIDMGQKLTNAEDVVNLAGLVRVASIGGDNRLSIRDEKKGSL